MKPLIYILWFLGEAPNKLFIFSKLINNKSDINLRGGNTQVIGSLVRFFLETDTDL